MQIVIKIPEKEYQRWQKDGEMDALIVRNAIVNGTPLPKGHGRLIDADELLKNAFIREDEEGDIFVKKYYCINQKNFDYAPTIIEADKE